MNVRFLSEAEAEVYEASEYYEGQSQGLGDDFLAAVAHALDLIREHPEIGAPVPGELRRLVLQRFPYSLFYRLRGDWAVVTSVAHHRRKPGYWLKRL